MRPRIVAVVVLAAVLPGACDHAAASEPAATPASAGTRQMAASYGWTGEADSILGRAVDRESAGIWSPAVTGPSGACGIVQALPASKMAAGGPDGQTSAAARIRRGLADIKDQYSAPCHAGAHEQAGSWC